MIALKEIEDRLVELDQERERVSQEIMNLQVRLYRLQGALMELTDMKHHIEKKAKDVEEPEGGMN